MFLQNAVITLNNNCTVNLPEMEPILLNINFFDCVRELKVM